jgi:hypothetical protein
METRSHTRERSGRSHLALALLTLSACARLPSPALLRAGDQPVLFLGSEPSAAQIGYVSADVPVTITGRPQHGRVPVRIDGALRTRGFVDEHQLALRVQRRGRVRGTPIYVAPDDELRVLGGLRRLRVRAQAQLHGKPLGPAYEGTYPRQGLAARAAPADALQPEPGQPYGVPAGMALLLCDAPGGAPVLELPAQRLPYEVRVLNSHEGWLAVRAGDGPYLIGWTPAALAPLTSASASALRAPVKGALPARITSEPGALKRVAQGTRVVFGDTVIGVLEQPGYARVVKAYEPEGYADVFVAADDGVALRGLVRAADLSEPP